MTITPAQCRAARALLGIGAKSLHAALTGLTPADVRTTRGKVPTFETGQLVSPVYAARLRETLEGMGVEFVPDGVRLHDRSEGDLGG